MGSENAAASGGLRIAVSGASGFVGSALVRLLTDDGHTGVRLVRGGWRPWGRGGVGGSASGHGSG